MHTTVLLLELGAIIFGLGVLGRLARLARLSPIPLYLLAGLFFGRGGVYPLVTSERFLSVGAQIGVILLLLLLGLEYSASELITNLRLQAPAGLLNFLVNAAPGAVAGLVLGWSPVAVVAMAGVTYATSSGIVAKLLTDLRRLGNRETPTVLSLLVLEDLSMTIYLPILTALLAGVGLAGAGTTLGVAVAAVTIVLLIALRFGNLISRLVFSPDDEVLLLLVFGLALLVGGVATQVQVSDAVGAFLVGIAMSGRVAEGARVVLAPLRDLFAAMFFVFFGLRTVPGAIPPVLGVAAVLAAVTASTKIGIGWWAARRAGVAAFGRIRAGTVIVARGEFNIIIAGLATTAGVEASLGPLAAAYILIMAVTGPLLARFGEPVYRRLLRLRGRLPKPRRALPADGRRPPGRERPAVDHRSGGRPERGGTRYAGLSPAGP